MGFWIQRTVPATNHSPGGNSPSPGNRPATNWKRRHSGKAAALERPEAGACRATAQLVTSRRWQKPAVVDRNEQGIRPVHLHPWSLTTGVTHSLAPRRSSGGHEHEVGHRAAFSQEEVLQESKFPRTQASYAIYVRGSQRGSCGPAAAAASAGACFERHTLGPQAEVGGGPHNPRMSSPPGESDARKSWRNPDSHHSLHSSQLQT